MTDLLSSREWAILTWGAVLLGWAALHKDIRKSFYPFAKSLLNPKIYSLIFVVFAYVAGSAYLYCKIGFGYHRLWIDASLWSIYGIHLVGRYITKREYSSVASDVVRENARGFAFFELIVNTYTFIFVVELVLIPAITMVAMLRAAADSDAKYEKVGRLMDWLFTLVGFSVLSFAVGQAITEPGTLRNLDVVFAVAFPVVMAIVFIPVIYLALLISCYEQIFIRLNMGTSNPLQFKQRAKWEIFKFFGFSYLNLNSFVGPRSANLMNVTSLEDVKELLYRKCK